ncbi:MAG: hypothetical protein ACR2IF_04425 [Terriglobales bacterium]
MTGGDGAEILGVSYGWGVNSRQKFTVRVAGAGILLLIAFAWHTLDQAGWIPHQADTSMYAGAEQWPANEDRKCVALPRDDGNIFFLGCVGDKESYADTESLPVTYWGRTRRPDRFQAVVSERLEAWQWRCRRKDDSVTCWAVN